MKTVSPEPGDAKAFWRPANMKPNQLQAWLQMHPNDLRKNDQAILDGIPLAQAGNSREFQMSIEDFLRERGLTLDASNLDKIRWLAENAEDIKDRAAAEAALARYNRMSKFNNQHSQTLEDFPREKHDYLEHPKYWDPNTGCPLKEPYKPSTESNLVTLDGKPVPSPHQVPTSPYKEKVIAAAREFQARQKAKEQPKAPTLPPREQTSPSKERALKAAREFQLREKQKVQKAIERSLDNVPKTKPGTRQPN